MPSHTLISAHCRVQTAAKAVLDQLAISIAPEDTEHSIATRAYQHLTSLGFSETWYYQCPAFVLAGVRSCLSISGKSYEASLDPIGEFNLVTVDLSPMSDGHWGDCARSFYVEDGKVCSEPATRELSSGKHFLASLHSDMRSVVHPSMEFHALFDWTNSRIKMAGFKNLDFLGNVGHSIATRREDRQYIEANNRCRLGDVPFFTFEPHVSEANGHWGFKHENIFYFNDEGVIEEL